MEDQLKKLTDLVMAQTTTQLKKEEQHKELMAKKEEELAQHQKAHKQELALMREQITKLSEALEKGTGAQITQAPKLSIDPFVADDELWKDYLKRFETAVKASNLPASLKASTFLSKQSHSVYKELDVYAMQMATPKTADELDFEEITKYMEKQ